MIIHCIQYPIDNKIDVCRGKTLIARARVVQGEVKLIVYGTRQEEWAVLTFEDMKKVMGEWGLMQAKRQTALEIVQFSKKKAWKENALTKQFESAFG